MERKRSKLGVKLSKCALDFRDQVGFWRKMGKISVRRTPSWPKQGK